MCVFLTLDTTKKMCHFLLFFRPFTSGAISCSCSRWHQDLMLAEKRESTADRCSLLFQAQMFDFGFTAGWDFSSSHISEPLQSSEGGNISSVHKEGDEGAEWGEAHWNDSRSLPPWHGDHTAPKCSTAVGTQGIEWGGAVPLMVRRRLLQLRRVSPHLQSSQMYGSQESSTHHNCGGRKSVCVWGETGLQKLSQFKKTSLLI